MRPDGYWLGLVGGVLVLLMSVELVRRRFVRGRLALAWVFLGVVAVVFALFPSALEWLTTVLHVQVPLNLVLFSGVLFLLVISMQLANEVGRLEARTRRLAEELAILGSQLPRSDDRTDGGGAARDHPRDDSGGTS